MRRDKRKPVGEKVIASACETLRHALRLATCERVGPNRFLLASDPSRGLSVPANPDPKRPLWSYDEYRALCAVADKVHPYMLTLLVLHYEAGRRLGANCGLRWSDWLPDDGPYGKLRWRGETDKQDRTTETPISMELRDAIEAHRRRFPGVGDAAVFPDSVRPGQVLRTHWPKNWILRCERLAEIEHVEHRGWHGFRRNFASELRHHSDVDVMELGGWRDLRTLKRCYQAADTDGMIAALEDRRRLRRAQ